MSRLPLVLLLVLLVVVCDARPGRRRGHRKGRRRGLQRDEYMYMPFRHRFFGSPMGRGKFPHSWSSSFQFWMSRRPWYNGPNVCTHETKTNGTAPGEYGIGMHHEIRTEVCENKESAYRCEYSVTKGGIKNTVVVIKECCAGFSRKTGDYGCPTAFRLQTLMRTARDLQLNEFIRAVQSVNLESDIMAGNFTVFAPNDQAFSKYSAAKLNDGNFNDMGSVVMVSRPIADVMIEDLRDILLNHVTTEILTTGRLKDEQLIETSSPSKSNIRVNFYDGTEKLMTANCKKVVSRNNQASNGVIHIVEEIMQPVSESLVDVVAKKSELSYLKTALGRSSLGQTLRADGQMTLFAPTDNAFKKLDRDVLNRLLRNPKCLDKVLKHHLLPNVVCSSAIQGKASTVNVLMKPLLVNRTAGDKVFVEKAQIVAADIMATNGVVHLIDEVLIPDDALGILDMVQKQNATKVLELIDRAGLKKTLQEAENITFFVPIDEAIAKLDPMLVDTLSRDPTALGDVLKFHVTPTETQCKYVYNGFELDTLNTGKKIVIHEYSHFFSRQWVQTAQCARIITGNIPSCNGLIHLVDKVLIPPVGNVIDVLAQDIQFSQLVGLLKRAGIADALQGKGPFTIFAPTNKAFQKIPQITLDNVLSDNTELEATLKNHVINGFLCSAGIFEDNWFRMQKKTTLANTFIHVRKEGTAYRVQDATVETSDLTGTNGVIHAIDEVILPTKRPDVYYFY